MTSRDTAAPAIAATELTKRFGAFKALDRASLNVAAGTIHALVGENGAGKSTVLGALAGRITVDEGQIAIFGHRIDRLTPRIARRMGVAAIYQELTILPTLTACANVYLGQNLSVAGTRRDAAMRVCFEALCERLGVSIGARVRAGNLSVADQQMLEIMRALESRARIILLDEPTASLVQSERDSLFQLMRELRASGVTMVLVSHKLEEVLDLADEVTVYRNGKVVSSSPVGAWSKQTLVSAMLGSAAPDLLGTHRARQPLGPEVMFSVDRLSVPSVLSDVAFSARTGEILGIAGLVGSGRTTVLRALAGAEPHANGSLTVSGRSRALPRSVRSALAAGFALVPEDRKSQGVLPAMSARANVAIASAGRYSRLGIVRRRLLRREVASVAESFAFDSRRLDRPAREFSGGNQQKLLLARWRLKNPKVLLADEPTRGIDVGAKAAILQSLREFADRGATVVVVSSELEELTTIADRVIVLAHGRKVAEYEAGADGVSVEQMLSAAFTAAP
jgi:rhamnose transport system ATP-binding protein